MIIDNFARCCQDQDVFFLDNTYLDASQVFDRAKPHDRSIILSLVDPPYPWTVLQNQLQDINYVLVGTDAPDIATHFWLVHAHLEFPEYTDADLALSQSPRVFLNYNFRPHEHRINLIKHLHDRGIEHLGVITTQETHIPAPIDTDKQLDTRSSSAVLGLGNMNIWQNHFLNVVSETVFRPYRQPEIIVSEKTLKPLLGLRPFVINGSPRYYDILESWGIDVFSDLWPIRNMRIPEKSVQTLMDRNHAIICDIIKDLSKDNLVALYKKLLPRLEHNRQRIRQVMYDEYQRLCVNDVELVWRRSKESNLN